MLIKIQGAAEVAPGQMRSFLVDGTKVNVVNADGQHYAIDDTCTHMGCSLANGRLDGTTVTCACHGSQFDVITGSVLRGPAQRPVRPHPVHLERGALVVEVPG